MEDVNILDAGQRQRALDRLREDMSDPNWGLEDVSGDDLLSYLDLGDLFQILDRYSGSASKAERVDIRDASRLSIDSGILQIRKRVMHPVRPLEPEDISKLIDLASSLPTQSPSLEWTPLLESVEFVSTDSQILELSEVEIPEFWSDDITVFHNLPLAEFDDTGFIGRQEDRRQIKSLLLSDNKVLTIVGEGGIGKTALALRVCHDILEMSDPPFERIVWVSLKVKYLTPSGVKQVRETVDLATELVTVSEGNPKSQIVNQDPWEIVVRYMSEVKTLLVIDNLETVGASARDLLVRVPQGSKVLMTSRIGLGELELRYQLRKLSTFDATRLFRNLTLIYNYQELRRLPDSRIKSYCTRLGNNPLLIKWFVLAWGEGSSPQELLRRSSDFIEVLDFCYENVYAFLDETAKHIISVMLAARRQLTLAQLQDLTRFGHIEFRQAFGDLIRSSFIDRQIQEDGSMLVQIQGLVYEYLSNHFPPSDGLVANVRQRMDEWQREREHLTALAGRYRYGPYAIHITNQDEGISAQYLNRAVAALKTGNLSAANRFIDSAETLTPDWWEVFRFRALVAIANDSPQFEVEEAFEHSTSLDSNDINRFHYAVYLMRNGEYERAVSQVELALDHPEVDRINLESLKGVILMRSEDLEGALPLLQNAWESTTSGIPMRIRRTRGTAFTDVYRRLIQRDVMNQDSNQVACNLESCLELALSVAKACGWDRSLAQTTFDAIYSASKISGGLDSLPEPVVTVLKDLDCEEDFRACCLASGKVRQMVKSSGTDLPNHFPKLTTTVGGAYQSGQLELHIGEVVFMSTHFGFLSTEGFEDVHFNRGSLTFATDWNELHQGRTVRFSVTQGTKGPHATQMRLV